MPVLFKMNLRRSAYFMLLALRGQPLGYWYERYLREEQKGISPDTSRTLLIQLLEHCRKSVPYYAEIMRRMGDSFYEDPEEYLRHFPVLTREIIRNHFDELKSRDLHRRRWYYDSSGGSTGEPVRFIHDWDHAVRSGAISLLFSRLAGKEVGEPEIQVWGSTSDITKNARFWKARLLNRLTNTVVLNAFCMTPGTMREFIDILNTELPRLIIAYAEPIYELAKFAECEGLEVLPQTAIITSAGTLYHFMRDKISKVFNCKVFNRYGCREVGDIACERPGHEGLWIAPWGNYVEIVDDKGGAVPDGKEGEILLTCLTNYSMPFIRYKVGDLGTRLEQSPTSKGNRLFLGSVSGRVAECLFKKDGTIVTPEYFIHMVGVALNTGWIRKFQVIQERYDLIRVLIVSADRVQDPHKLFERELSEISHVIRVAMGQDCELSYTFVDDIPPKASGKYQFIVCNIRERRA